MSHILPNGILLETTISSYNTSRVKGLLFLTSKELENKAFVKLLVLNFSDTQTLKDRKILEIDTEEDILGYKVITATSIKNMQELRAEFLKYKTKQKVIKNYFLKELVHTRITQTIHRLDPNLKYIRRLTVADLNQEEFEMFNFYREHIFGQDVISQAFYESQVEKSKTNSMLIYE